MALPSTKLPVEAVGRSAPDGTVWQRLGAAVEAGHHAEIVAPLAARRKRLPRGEYRAAVTVVRHLRIDCPPSIGKGDPISC